MKLKIVGKMKEESQLDISFNKLELTFSEPQLGIDVQCKLNHERGKPIDNVNEHAVIKAEEILAGMNIMIIDEGVEKNITKYQLANLATKIVFGAIESVTNAGLIPINGYVSSEKDKLKKWKQSQADIKKEIEKAKIDVEKLKKEKEIEDEVNRRVREIVGSMPDGFTTEVVQQAVSNPVARPNKEKPKVESTGPKTVNFMGRPLTVHPMGSK